MKDRFRVATLTLKSWKSLTFSTGRTSCSLNLLNLLGSETTMHP